MSEASEYAQSHEKDLPSPDTVTQELHTWHSKFTSLPESDVPNDLLAAYKIAEDSISFPNICYLLKVMLTIPATSASTERANSTLKFIKTRLRSSLSQKALNTFVLGYKHKDILNSLDESKLAQLFINMKRRRLLLLNPISD